MNGGLRIILALTALVGSVAAQAQGVLTPTGGTLVGVTPTTVSAAYGSFSATDNLDGGTLASVSGNYSQTGLTLNSAANTIYLVQTPVVGTDSGTIGFTLSADTEYQFAWTSSYAGPPNAGASLTITGSAGNVVLSCSVAGYPEPLGCVAGPGAGTGVTLSPTLIATLPADTYSIAFSTTAGYQFGTPVDSNFAFGFGPPPPPVAPTVTPTVTGTTGANGWYVSPASISWNVTGTPTPVTSGCGNVVASDTTGTTYTCTATNSVATASASVVIKQDTVAPTVNISAPAQGATYKRRRVVVASYSCADATSGVATCAGTFPSGTPVDTSTAGQKTFTVTATDNAGNQTVQSVTYIVHQ